MITKFLSFEDFHGRKNIGGTRLRVHWPIAKWKEAGPDIGEASLYKFGDDMDVCIYQKVYNWDHAENFNGIKILDLCDPDFLHAAYPVKRMINACDAVTCSSEKLAEVVTSFAGEKPVWFIPDMVMDPEKLPVKEHKGRMKSVAWFGYADNFAALDQAIPAILKRGLELIVVATAPYEAQSNMEGLKLRNLPWGAETWERDFMTADIVINPKLNRGRFAFKSDNKTIHPWACGMPVAHNDTELDLFWEEEVRVKEGKEKRQYVIENRSVNKQVEMLKQLILEIKEKKK